MKKKKKLEMRYVVLLILVLFALILGVIAKVMTTDRNLTPIEKGIKDCVLGVNRVLFIPVNWVSNFFSKQTDKNDLYQKYKELESQKEQFDFMQIKTKEMEREIESLKKVLELNQTLSEASYLNATVINRNLGYWYHTITIDKGEKNGVKKGMAVIIKDGLIGTVDNTSNYHSTVKLLTSNTSNDKISVKIVQEGMSIYGLLSGFDEKTKQFTIEGIAQNVEIKEGSIVTTTGMGDLFPSGILIGSVSNVTTDHFDLAKIVKVESSIDFNDLSFVTVLKRQEEQK